jgi:NAD(P)H-dependent FMN reductase
MSDSDVPLLSQLADADTPEHVSDRRTFIRRASALTLAIPGLGGLLAACAPPGEST